MFQKEIRTEVEIEAPAEKVWLLLTPLAASARERAKIFRPKITRLEPNREMRWEGRLWISGLFDGEHIFEIEQTGANRVIFVQREIFHGLLVPLFASTLEKDTRRDFEEMNRALKQQAETQEFGRGEI